MRVRSILIVASAVVFVGSLPQTALGEAAIPNLAGTYQCEPAPEQCRSGRSPLVIVQPVQRGRQ